MHLILIFYTVVICTNFLIYNDACPLSYNHAQSCILQSQQMLMIFVANKLKIKGNMNTKNIEKKCTQHFRQHLQN